MKVRVSMPGVYMAMEMEEEQARMTFHKMAELLWLIGGRSQKQPENAAMEKEEEPEQTVLIHPAEPVPVEEVIPDLEQREPETVAGAPEQDGKETVSKLISAGYGGYLYMKCPVCGKNRGFCAKTRLNNFRCECGSVTKIENMVPLYMKCECGRQARYMTNMTESEFDITCYDCGNPVAVKWNEKKHLYEPMGQEEGRWRK